MFDYYQHFKDNGNHPNKDNILKLESMYQFDTFDKNIANTIIQKIILISKKYDKRISARIIFENQLLSYYGDYDNQWLSRKEKVCYATSHSSYYIFLDSLNSNQYNYMITDESYALCGGCFPILIANKCLGTICISGLRPKEDHQLIIDALDSLRNDELNT